VTIDPARVAVVVPAWNEAGKIGDVARHLAHHVTERRDRG
jgi:hypothetical protein